MWLPEVIDSDEEGLGSIAECAVPDAVAPSSGSAPQQISHHRISTSIPSPAATSAEPWTASIPLLGGGQCRPRGGGG